MKVEIYKPENAEEIKRNLIRLGASPRIGLNPYSLKHPAYIIKEDDGEIVKIIGDEKDRFALRNLARRLVRNNHRVKNLAGLIESVANVNFAELLKDKNLVEGYYGA